MVSQQYSDALPVGEAVEFLHRMDSVEGEAMVVTTDRMRLSRASFLDGRETFWIRDRIVPLRLKQSDGSPALRYIFHIGFCGSTLLSRLIDKPGRVLTLKEPQCLADIAGQRALIGSGRAIAPLAALLDHARDSLGKIGEPDIPVVVKPTNWVNSLLPELCNADHVSQALFVSMDLRAFLTAAIRGGRDRLAFCSRLASQIAPVLEGGNACLAEAIAATSEPLDRVLLIVALLHAMQERLFDHAIAANKWSNDVRMDFSDIIDNPEEMAARARKVLRLPAEPAEPGRAALLMERHTKDPSAIFSATARTKEDRFIACEHGDRMDRAIEWVGARQDCFG